MSEYLYEERTETVGDYIVFAAVSYDYGWGNPLKEMESGEIHTGGGDRDHLIGEPSEFRRAVGFHPEYGVEVDSDYGEAAATLAVLNLTEEEARELLTDCIEGGYIEPSDIDYVPDDDDAPPLVTEDEVDVEALPLSVVHSALMTHAIEVMRSTYQRSVTSFVERMEELALELTKQAIEARAVGDKYAVPLSVSGYHATCIEVEEDKSFCDMDDRDAVWVPGESMTDELDKLPYPEAIETARKWAAGDAKLVSDWASGNVFDMHVCAYRLQYDEDGEPIEERGEYEDAEAEWEERCSGIYGDEEAKECLESFMGDAQKHVETLQAKLASDVGAQP